MRVSPSRMALGYILDTALQDICARLINNSIRFHIDEVDFYGIFYVHLGRQYQ